jgi:predicted RNA-binding protein YlxR (DUF448 family)
MKDNLNNRVCISCFEMKPINEMVLKVSTGFYTCNDCKEKRNEQSK